MRYPGGVDAVNLLFSRFPGAQDVRGTSALRRPKRSGDRRTGSNPVYSTQKASADAGAFLFDSPLTVHIIINNVKNGCKLEKYVYNRRGKGEKPT